MALQDTTIMETRRVPKSAVLILVSTLFSRYCVGAFQSILLLFVNLKLGYDTDTSTTIFHAYALFGNFFAIIGAIMADSSLGIYKTMLLMSVVFAAGAFTITIGVIDVFHLPVIAFSFVGLMVVTFGEGCLKPLSRTYGAQQYKPTEAESIALFFSLYFFVLNCGSITSRIISPILRQEVTCFGNDDSFPLAFGITGFFMIVVAVLTIVANTYSETYQATGTTLLNMFHCIWYALITKIRSKSNRNISKKRFWLDYSEEKYGKEIVNDSRLVLDVFLLNLPIMVFWALFYQQGSRWTLQAVRMNGDLGFYTIIPDQFSVVHPILLIFLIPVFEYVVHPALSKVGIKSDLQKVTLGGVLAGLAFLISAVVESQIENYKHLHMTWLLPQCLVMSIADLMIVIPMMKWSYSVAPSSMKTMLQAFQHLSMGLGNLIVIIVVESKLINSQIYEFILFAVLMFVDVIVFAFLSNRFTSSRENKE